jgi:hypothetical protein
MNRKYFTLMTEPRGDVYRRLLQYAAGECAVALLVVRPTLPLSVTGENVLARLKTYLQEKTESSEWPGTTLLDEVAWVFRYRYAPECVAVLARAAGALYSWKQPRLPEDLCLLRADGDPWLVSIAHEKDSYVFVSEDEKARLLATVPHMRAVIEP